MATEQLKVELSGRQSEYVIFLETFAGRGVVLRALAYMISRERADAMHYSSNQLTLAAIAQLIQIY